VNERRYRDFKHIQLANVLIRFDRPHYAQYVERARREPGAALPDVHGIWVPETWIVGAKFI
jgi:hypothetical protein